MSREHKSNRKPQHLQLGTESEVARHLGVTPSCLQAWRYKGEGPPYVKLSKGCIRYDFSDLEEWIDDRRCQSTSNDNWRA